MRNDEQGFFLCQAHQNIYRASKKIKIQWLSENNDKTKQGDVYVKEFYDNIGKLIGFKHRYLIEGDTASTTDYLPTNVKYLVGQSLSFFEMLCKTWCIYSVSFVFQFGRLELPEGAIYLY